MGILSIELSWHDQVQCDARGNCGVGRAFFTFVGDSGIIDRGQVIDVHLSCQ